MLFMQKNYLTCLLTILLSACFPSESSTDTDNNSGTDPNPISTWQQGSFLPNQTFKNYCSVPRTGRDLNGNTYPDLQGTSLDEKMWLRSWSNDTYLWYQEIVDRNPNQYTTPQAYFAELKTFAKTATGQSKDKYHYYQNTAEYNQVASTGVSLGYGLQFILQSGSPPRKATVAYVLPDSPASQAGIARGDTVLEINNQDFINGGDLDKILDGWSPTEASPTHQFKFRQLNGSNLDVNLTAKNIAEPPVLLNKTFTLPDTQSTKVGYVMLNTFGTYVAEKALYDTFTSIKENHSGADALDELVLDLRYNGGGYLYISSQLGYMLGGNQIPGNSFFIKDTFNNKHPTINPITNRTITPTPFYNLTSPYNDDLNSNLALPSLNLKRVYILSTDNTCSASEALINALEGVDIQVVLIGTQTCGKPYGFYSTDNCGTTYSTIQFKGSNAKGFGDYSDGFIPTTSVGVQPPYINGCVVADDLANPLGDKSEGLLNAALYHVQNNGACPATAQSSSSKLNRALLTGDKDNLLNHPRMQQYLARKNNAIHLPTID